MKKILLLLVFKSHSLCAQETTHKRFSFEPAFGFLFIQTVDNTIQQNTTTARGFSFNPRLTLFINQQFECGIQPSITVVKSAFTSIESGEGYSIGYLLRYYPKRLVFKETIKGHNNKFEFIGHPFVGFEHEISTIYPDVNDKARFSNHLQTQNFSLSVGINTYFWRRFYFNLSIGMGYTPKLLNNTFYPLGLWSLGYTFQKKSKKSK